MAGGSGTQSGGSGGWSGAAGGNSTWGGASNSTAGRGGSSGGRPAYLREMFARREKANEHTLEYMAAGLCGLLAIFIFFHWTRVLVNRHMRRTKGAPLFIPGSLTPFASFSR